jgi:hypothetical protein
MGIFDLVFIVVFLSSCAAFVYALTGLGRARRVLPGLAVGLVFYLALVFFTAHVRYVDLGQAMCSDDWCASADHVSRKDGVVSIEFRVWSRAKRATFRETNVQPYLVDDQKRRYPVTEASGAPFDTAVSPGDSFTTTRRFGVEPDARRLELHLRPKSFPGYLIIAAQDAVVPLTPGPGPV